MNKNLHMGKSSELWSELPSSAVANLFRKLGENSGPEKKFWRFGIKIIFGKGQEWVSIRCKQNER